MLPLVLRLPAPMVSSVLAAVLAATLATTQTAQAQKIQSEAIPLSLILRNNAGNNDIERTAIVLAFSSNANKKSPAPAPAPSSPPNQRRRQRGRRRGNNRPSRVPPPQPNQPISKYTTQHHMAPPLKNSNGDTIVPALPVTVTNEENVIKQWLQENTLHYSKGDVDDGNSAPETTMVLGFDSESIAKPPWMMPQRASLPDGPAIVQFSTDSSCLIARCSRVSRKSINGGDETAVVPYISSVVQDVLCNTNIVKAGVGIDDDALELYRWSSSHQRGSSSSPTTNDEKTTWKMTSRFDLGCITSQSNPGRRVGLRQLAHEILNVDLPKSKRLAMSNWHEQPYLSNQQISYAARDAWVSAAIVQRLCDYRNDVFDAKALIDSVLKNERCLEEMDQRARKRKVAVTEYKMLKERKKEIYSGEIDDDKNNDDSSSSSSVMKVWTDEEEKRMNELWDIMSTLRADQPPVFDNERLGLPF